MDKAKATRQAKLRQKLQQLKQRQDEEFAKQTIEQFGISAESCTWLLSEDQQAIDYVEWLNRAFLWQGSQIHWAKVRNSTCFQCQKDPQITGVFEQLCQQFQLGNPTVTLIWFNVYNPLLQMKLSIVQQKALALFTHDWDTWIVQPEAGWCIECHHEGTLCFGYRVVEDAIQTPESQR